MSVFRLVPVLQAGVQEASRGAERGVRGGQGLVAGAVGTEQRAGTGQRQGELAEESGGPAGAGMSVSSWYEDEVLISCRPGKQERMLEFKLS